VACYRADAEFGELLGGREGVKVEIQRASCRGNREWREFVLLDRVEVGKIERHSSLLFEVVVGEEFVLAHEGVFLLCGSSSLFRRVLELVFEHI